MTTYAERRERLFWSQSKHRKSKIRKKRSVNKLKRYGSNIDQRLWSNNCDDRRRAILEKLTYIDTGLLSQAITACFAGSTGGSNGEGGNQEYMKKIKDLENEILKLSQIIKFLEENCDPDKSVKNSEKDSSKSLVSNASPFPISAIPSKSSSGREGLSSANDELAVTEEDPCGSETHIVCAEDLYPCNDFGGFLCYDEPQTIQLSGIPTGPVKPTEFQPFLPVDCSCYDATKQICSETQETASTPHLSLCGLQEEISACDECWRDDYSSRTNIFEDRNKNDDNIRTEKESVAHNIRQQIQKMCCLTSGRDLCSCESAIDSEVICVLKAAVDILEENWLREDREKNKYTKLLQMYQAQCSSMKALKCQLSNVIQQKESLKRKLCSNVSDGILTDINAVKTTQSFLSNELKKLQLMSVNLNNIALERDALTCKLQELESVARSKEFQLVDYKTQIEKQQGVINSLMRTLKSSKIEDCCFENKQYNNENMPLDYYKIPSRHYSFSDTQMNVNENEQINTKILQEKIKQQQKLIEVQKECMLQQKMYICEQEEVKNCLVNKVEELLKLKIRSLKDQNESKKMKRGSVTKSC